MLCCLILVVPLHQYSHISWRHQKWPVENQLNYHLPRYPEPFGTLKLPCARPKHGLFCTRASVVQPGQMAASNRFVSGWRASVVTLLFAAAAFTILLCSLLLVSLFRVGKGWASLGDNSLLFIGNCNTSSRLSLGLHLLINIVGSGILASSNFFMQILLAPTRKDVDRAHKRSRFAEIGVQSFRNLRIVPCRMSASGFFLL